MNLLRIGLYLAEKLGHFLLLKLFLEHLEDCGALLETLLVFDHLQNDQQVDLESQHRELFRFFLYLGKQCLEVVSVIEEDESTRCALTNLLLQLLIAIRL